MVGKGQALKQDHQQQAQTQKQTTWGASQDIPAAMRSRSIMYTRIYMKAQVLVMAICSKLRLEAFNLPRNRYVDGAWSIYLKL